VLANPSIDYQVHNTLFLVAHFHNMLIPGLLFGMLAAYHFWFPKAFGFRLDERWGMIAAVCWIIGFVLAFFPLYALGLLGFPRRTVAFFDPVYVPYFAVALVGAAFVLAALGSLIIQLWVSVRHRETYRVPAGDPWDGRSLEWATPSPPPEYNFPAPPLVTSRDAFTHAKDCGIAYQTRRQFNDIKMPKNSAMGPALGVSGMLIGFALVWHMWWLAVAGSLAVAATLILRGFVRNTDKTIPAREVEGAHEEWLRLIGTTPAVSRVQELDSANAGLSAHAALRTVQ
jgi:cytochrome o ubiquinol oxidase subunit 1